LRYQRNELRLLDLCVGRAIWEKEREPMPRSDCIWSRPPSSSPAVLRWPAEAGAALMLRVAPDERVENAVAFLFGMPRPYHTFKCPQISGHIFAAEEDFTHVGKLTACPAG